jgi:murein DD-endopeptidase MepM/ murein hydrolase activator NlpD
MSWISSIVRHLERCLSRWTVVVCTAGLLAATSAPAWAGPPAGRTYFTIFLGTESPFSEGADCMRFTRDEICTSSDLCGSWFRTEPVGPESAIAFEFRFDDGGQPTEIEGQARIDNRGKKNTLAAVARYRQGREVRNFGFVGRPARPRECLGLLAEWTRANPPAQGERNPVCLERAEFGDPGDSLYVLPYPVRIEYWLNQSYCFLNGGHTNQLAYDFSTPIGSEVTAARAGFVREVREDLPDIPNNDPDVHNRVFIEHDDGTVAFYAHLQQNGVVVEVGDRVEAGQLIAYNGNSGNTGGIPHLHFMVYQGWPPQHGEDVPINFRNALGPLDELGGLMRGVFYKAQ